MTEPQPIVDVGSYVVFVHEPPEDYRLGPAGLWARVTGMSYISKDRWRIEVELRDGGDERFRVTPLPPAD